MPPILLTRRQCMFRSVLVAPWCSGCATARSRPGAAQSIRSDDEAARSRRVEPVDPLQTAADLVALHNRVRAEAKLPSLTVSKKLQAAALDHARDMADREKMTH